MLDAFACGARHALASLLGAEPTACELGPAAWRHPRPNELCALVGFCGDATGQLMIGMARATASALAASVLGVPPAEAEAVAGSAVAELANILAGACATRLAQKGVRTAITVPTVLLGECPAECWPPLPTREARFDLPFGPLFLSFAVAPDGAARGPHAG